MTAGAHRKCDGFTAEARTARSAWGIGQGALAARLALDLSVLCASAVQFWTAVL
jgi:hypothetical protein